MPDVRHWVDQPRGGLHLADLRTTLPMSDSMTDDQMTDDQTMDAQSRALYLGDLCQNSDGRHPKTDGRCQNSDGQSRTKDGQSRTKDGQSQKKGGRTTMRVDPWGQNPELHPALLPTSEGPPAWNQRPQSRSAHGLGHWDGRCRSAMNQKTKGEAWRQPIGRGHKPPHPLHSAARSDHSIRPLDPALSPRSRRARREIRKVSSK
ncbi:hypothetical protein MCETE7_01868 [Acidimicrobiia bacterium]